LTTAAVSASGYIAAIPGGASSILEVVIASASNSYFDFA
jgi:hypothetical protein